MSFQPIKKPNNGETKFIFHAPCWAYITDTVMFYNLLVKLKYVSIFTFLRNVTASIKDMLDHLHLSWQIPIRQDNNRMFIIQNQLPQWIVSLKELQGALPSRKSSIMAQTKCQNHQYLCLAGNLPLVNDRAYNITFTRSKKYQYI